MLGLVAQFNIPVLGRDFDQSPACQPRLGFGQLGQFVDDFRRTHDGEVTMFGPVVRSRFHLFAILRGVESTRWVVPEPFESRSSLV